MNFRKHKKRLSAMLALSLLLALLAGCNSGGKTDGQAKSENSPNTLRGVGSEDSQGTCSVKPEYSRIDNLPWRGFEKKAFFNMTPSTNPNAHVIKPNANIIVYEYAYGDCHGDTVDCSQLTPRCKCRFTYTDNGSQVIQLEFPNPENRASIQIDGLAIVVIDEGGGGGD